MNQEESRKKANEWFDWIQTLSDQEKLDWLEEEVKKLVDSVEDPVKKKRLLGLHWKIRNKVNLGQENYITLSRKMMESFEQLRAALNEV